MSSPRLLSPAAPEISRARAAISFVALAAIFAGLLLDALHQINKGNFSAFTTYYRAAGLMRSGHSPYGSVHAYPYVYPPLWAWLYQALVPLSAKTAARIMLGVNAAFLAGSIVLSARSVLRRMLGTAPLGTLLSVSLIATLLVVSQVHKELRSYQTDVVLLIGFVGAICCLDRSPRIAGGVLAFAASIKYLPLIAAPYLVLRRRWITLGALLVGVIGLALLPALTLGMRLDVHYLHQSLGGLSHLVQAAPPTTATPAQRDDHVARVHGLTADTDHSASSAVARVSTVLHWPSNVALISIALFASAWLAFVFWNTNGGWFDALTWPVSSAQEMDPFRQRLAIEWAGLMTAAMVFSPAAVPILAIYPATVYAALLCCVPRARRSPGILCGAASLFLAMLLPFGLMGHAFSVDWNVAGVSCWMLLISGVLLTCCAPPLLAEAVRVPQSPGAVPGIPSTTIATSPAYLEHGCELSEPRP